MISTLDLHGYKISQTNNIIDSFISDQLLFGVKKVEIITGDSKDVKGVVKKVIKNYGLNCKEHLYNKQVLTIVL